MTDLNQGPVEPQSPDKAQPPFQDGAGPTGVEPVETKSPMIALVFGVLSWIVIPSVLADSYTFTPRDFWVPISLLLLIPPIVFGVKGRRDARRGRTSHRGMATAGLWLGAIWAVFAVLLVLGQLMIALITALTQ